MSAENPQSLLRACIRAWPILGMSISLAFAAGSYRSTSADAVASLGKEMTVLTQSIDQLRHTQESNDVKTAKLAQSLDDLRAEVHHFEDSIGKK